MSSRRPMTMPRSTHGAVGDPTVRTMAFRIFLGRRAGAVRTQPWCDRPFTEGSKVLFNDNILKFRRQISLFWHTNEVQTP